MKRWVAILALFVLWPSIASAQTELAVGAKAPNFSVTTFEKKSIKLADYSGKPLVLVFSRAHW